MPAQYLEVMRAFAWLRFDWLSVFGPSECFGSFAHRLAATAISPLVALIVLAVGITLVLIVASKMSPEAEDGSLPISALVCRGSMISLPVVLVSTYAIVLPVSSRIFSTFSCLSFGYEDEVGATREFLNADLSVECTGEPYVKLQAFAGVLIAVWPVGVPVLFAALLHRSRRGKLWGVPLSHAIRFLHAEFTDRYYYWSLLEYVLSRSNDSLCDAAAPLPKV